MSDSTKISKTLAEVKDGLALSLLTQTDLKPENTHHAFVAFLSTLIFRLHFWRETHAERVTRKLGRVGCGGGRLTFLSY